MLEIVATTGTIRQTYVDSFPEGRREYAEKLFNQWLDLVELQARTRELEATVKELDQSDASHLGSEALDESIRILEWLNDKADILRKRHEDARTTHGTRTAEAHS